MAGTLSTASVNASGDKCDSVETVGDSFEINSSTIGSSNFHPCSKRVRGSPSFEFAQCSKQQVHSFEPSHDSLETSDSESEPGCSFDAKPSTQHVGPAVDHVVFSEVQISCPTVIEIFCSSARVTASLKELGLSQSFGVDHDVRKAESTAKRRDLTLKSDQEYSRMGTKSQSCVDQ